MVQATLVGRDDELAELRELVTRGEFRLVTLTGPSGVGKTRLAAAVLEGFAPDDVVDVPLASITEAALMGDAIVERILPGPAACAPADALWQRFAGRRVLMLLDNLEQVHGAGDVVAGLLGTYPALSLLTTSLRPLGVAGERVVTVGRLGVPADDGDDATRAPAVVLFVQRARMFEPEFTAHGPTMSACAEVCRALGGLPLAIELAAARVRSVPLSLMVSQLAAGGLGLLRRDDPRTPPRHQSLGAALAWTYDLLGDGPAASLLTALSVFEGPVTIDGVAAVAPAGHEVVDLVSELVDLHLVELHVAGGDEAEFSLPRPVRAFAARRLADRGEIDEALRCRDDFVLTRLRSGRPLSASEMPDALATLNRLRLAGRIDTALELALFTGWSLAPGARTALRSEVEELLDSDSDDSVLAARALVWTATHGPSVVDDRQEFARWTRRRVDRAIRSARLSGDRRALLDALELTVRTVAVTLDVELARASVEEGLALAAREGESGRLGRFQMWAGMVARAAGRIGPAGHLLRSARASGVAGGDRVAADYAAMYLHALAVETGTPSSLVLPELADLLDSAWEHRDGLAAGVVLSLLVDRALAAGDAAAAARFVAQLLPLGLERHAVEPLTPAAHLAIAVKVLAAAGRHRETAVIAGHLSTLGAVLTRSMAAADADAYERAVAGVASSLPDDVYNSCLAEGRTVTQIDALRRAQQAIASVIVTDPSAASSAPPRSDGHSPVPNPPLTARERQVLTLLAGGASNPEIARRLRISSKTAMHHTVSIYRKLQVSGRAAAAAWAARAGMDADQPT